MVVGLWLYAALRCLLVSRLSFSSVYFEQSSSQVVRVTGHAILLSPACSSSITN